MNIGSKIKSAREKKRMTQEELGAACGTTKQSIFKYETGVVTNIPLDRLEKIAEVLDISPAYLMGWEEKDEKPLVNDDEELTEYLEMLRTRPECRLLFSTTKGATKSQIEAIVKMIEEIQR